MILAIGCLIMVPLACDRVMERQKQNQFRTEREAEPTSQKIAIVKQEDNFTDKVLAAKETEIVEFLKNPDANADSTQARNMRWVLRFEVKDGKDYLNQLQMLEAEILVPIPYSDQVILIPDASEPNQRRAGTQDDMKRLSAKIKFNDTRPEAVRGVAKALGLDNHYPKAFWAFFPAEVAADMSRKELSYRNRRAEDIQETIFSVVVRNGKCEIVVEDQRVK